jgi:hypothetical protein
MDEFEFDPAAYVSTTSAIPGARVNGQTVAIYAGNGPVHVMVGQHLPRWMIQPTATAPDIATARRWIRGWWLRDRVRILQELEVDWISVNAARLKAVDGDLSKLPRLKDRPPAAKRTPRRRRR